MPFPSPVLNGVEIAATAILLLLLGWISIADLKRFRIPDPTVFLLIGLGLGYSAFVAGGWPGNALIGALTGFGVFAILGEAYFRRTGQDGLGLGDAKLLAAAGAWLGWHGLPFMVAMAAISALIYALVLGRRKLAFGPWLAASFVVAWVAGVRPYL